MTLFKSVRHKLLGLLAVSLTLSFALAAGAIAIFVTDFHAEATHARFHEAVSMLKRDLLERQASYERNVATIANDAGLIASLNLISQYGAAAPAQQEIFDAERRKLAGELRRLSANLSQTHVVLTDPQAQPIAALWFGDQDVVESYAQVGGAQPGIKARSLRRPDEWVSAVPPAALTALPPTAGVTLQSTWHRHGDRLLLAVASPIFKGVLGKPPQAVGQAVLLHEFTPAYAADISSHTGVPLSIHVNAASLPPGIEVVGTGAARMPALLTGDVESTLGHRETPRQFIDARTIHLVDGSNAYLLFSSDTDLLRSQVRRALGAIFVVLLVSTLAVLLLGQAVAERWISRPVQDLVHGIGAVRRGEYEALRQRVGRDDEFGTLSTALIEMADTVRRREVEIISSRDALAQSESRLSQVMTVTKEGIWDWILDSQRIKHNASWCTMLGLDTGRLEHPVDLFVSLLHEDDRAMIQARIRDCLAGKAQYTSEHRMRRADGQVIWVHDRGDVVERDADGRPLRMLGSMADITERKRAEAALLSLNQELELRVEQRTAQLAAARDEAERANMAKSEFLSRMSHELRTPMNAILGFGQLLESSQQISATGRDWGREIVLGGKHLLELINEVLDLARVESGKFSVSPEPVALLPLLQQCQMLVRPQADMRAIRMTEDTASCDVHVRADRTRLKQVLLNLLSNAVKYNRAEGRVLVACAADGEAIRINVTDTGAGLTAEQCSRLFVPFERLDADLKHTEGTGLGLALSKRLVELMGGQIGVESQPGDGSCFWVRLPRAPAHATEALLARAALPAPAHGAAGKRFDVLCIEDNAANLRLIDSVFRRRADIRLMSAIAPGLGLELARTHHPALILLDINLPDMDGYAVMQCLRESEATRRIPVVAISANAMPGDIERGRAAGFVDYLTKPLDIDRLLRVVDKILLDPGRAPT